MKEMKVAQYAREKGVSGETVRGWVAGKQIRAENRGLRQTYVFVPETDEEKEQEKVLLAGGVVEVKPTVSQDKSTNSTNRSIVEDYQDGEVVDVEGIGKVEVNRQTRDLLMKRAELALGKLVGKLEQEAAGFLTEQDVRDFERKQEDVDARQDELDNLHDSQDRVKRNESSLSRSYARIKRWYDGIDEKLEELKDYNQQGRARIDWDNHSTQNAGKSLQGVMGYVELWVKIRVALSELMVLPELPELDYEVEEEQEQDTDNEEMFEQEDEQEPEELDFEAVEKQIDAEVEKVESEVPVFEVNVAKKKRVKK